MKKLSILTATALSMTMLLNFNSVVVSATNTNENPEEYSNSEELKNLNGGQAPEIYSTEDNSNFIDGSYTNIKVNNEDDAINSIKSIQNILNIEHPENEFKVTKINKTDYLTSYKLQQVFNSVPLYGRELVVVTDNDGNTTSVNGNYLKDVDVNTTPEITENAVANYVSNAYGSDAKADGTELTIYSLDDVKPTLCWKVTIEQSKDEKTSVLNSFIDASTGKVIKEISLTNNAAVQATGTDLNGKTQTFNVNKTTAYSRYYGRYQTYQLYDPLRKIQINTSNSRRDRNGQIISNTNNKWTDPSAVSAMSNLSKTYDYYKNVLGRQSYDNNNSPIIANVHYTEYAYGRSWDNAGWFPGLQKFLFGDGGSSFKPLAGAEDVTGHEFTHAVVSYTCNLQYEGESGALNEAYADIMGNIIEGKDDPQWLMGEDIMQKRYGDALRGMANPEKYGLPSSYKGKYWVDTYDTDETNDYGGVHSNCGVISHAAYLMWKNGITDKTKLAKLFYNSLNIMTSTASFKDCRLAVNNAAKALKMSQDEINIINKSFDEVGVTV